MVFLVLKFNSISYISVFLISINIPELYLPFDVCIFMIYVCAGTYMCVCVGIYI